MNTRSRQCVDNLIERIDSLPVGTAQDIARVLPLYIKSMNDNGVVSNVSIAYIDNYDGKQLYRRFARHFDQMSTLFQRNGLLGNDIREIFKRVASREYRIPKTARGMEYLKGIVLEEVHGLLRKKRLADKRRKLVDRFKTAIKHYLNMTYELGFNEPSACAKFLAKNHKIDKYILAGDFPVMLLPFMPEIEDIIRKSYENYEMQDAWEILKGRYFNHKSEYANIATEIKSSLNKTIGNFSDYFDRIYTNTYYKMRLSMGGNGKNG